MSNKIRVLQKKSGYKPEVISVNNELRELQKLVGGYIQTVSFDYDDRTYALVCDEEGKIKKKEFNFIFGNDYIVGDVFFVRTVESDFGSLDDKDIENLKGLIAEMNK